MDISRHPILQAIYEAALAVESCGASPELTAASMKVNDLLQQADVLLDTIPAPAGYPCVIEEADFMEKTVLLKMSSHYGVRAGAHMLVPATHALHDKLATIALPVVDLMSPGASIETSEADATPWNPPEGFKLERQKPPVADSIMDMADKYAHADNAFEGGMLRMALLVAIDDLCADAQDQNLSAAARDVLEERKRQQFHIGATTEHDDNHVNEELAALAAFYAMPDGARDWDTTSTGYGSTLGEAMKPNNWDVKVGDRRRELVKAGALILAEIERLDRAAARTAVA